MALTEPVVLSREKFVPTVIGALAGATFAVGTDTGTDAGTLAATTRVAAFDATPLPNPTVVCVPVGLPLLRSVDDAPDVVPEEFGGVVAAATLSATAAMLEVEDTNVATTPTGCAVAATTPLAEFSFALCAVATSRLAGCALVDALLVAPLPLVWPCAVETLAVLAFVATGLPAFCAAAGVF